MDAERGGKYGFEYQYTRMRAVLITKWYLYYGVAEPTSKASSSFALYP